MRNVCHRLRYLKAWSPVGGIVYRGYGAFAKRSLAKVDILLRAGFEIL